jgi:hypothetical protein
MRLISDDAEMNIPEVHMVQSGRGERISLELS